MNWYDDFAGQVRLDVPLAPLTYFGVGGAAKYFIEPRDAGSLQAMAGRMRQLEIPIYVLGNGANLLVRDQGVNGAVVHLSGTGVGKEFKESAIDGTRVRAGAGKGIPKLIGECAQAGLSGLECLAGIPGSVGGEIRMNAGGAFGDIGSAVESVRVMDLSGNIAQRGREDLEFEYRRSNIAEKFILGATFALSEEDPERLLARMKEIWMYKQNSQPLAEQSAGCIFKNPSVAAPAGVPEGGGGKPSAGALIDRAGLKGTSNGGAEISPRHANFITAKKGTKASDILGLIELAKVRVKEKFGVVLETEVVVW